MSNIITDPQYDLCRAYIDQCRHESLDWDTLVHRGMTEEELDAWLVMQMKFNFWPSLGLTPADRLQRWGEIVAAKKAAEQWAIEATRPLVIVGVEESEPSIKVPVSARTAWQLYRKHLLDQDWKKETVDNIETSALKTLRHMRLKSLSPVKGLIVGHVQSGKTASMAGLLAMAADHGWNLFIVLTGTLENLRVQTRDRLLGDLFRPGNLSWRSINHPGPDSPPGHQAQNMDFSRDSRDRHLIVCLKNPARLEKLIAWIREHEIGMGDMRIVVIDDEADQAGINTANVSTEERTKINGLIVELASLPVQSVNYIAYTATPAANFLNEGPGEGLYPENFIVALKQSDEHFGPVQIFGNSDTGQQALGIVRTVSQDDLDRVKAVHDGDISELPESLEDSVLWFLCCVAAMRAGGFSRPISMLVHTSSRQAHHAGMEEAIKTLLKRFDKQRGADPKGFMRQCRQFWERVTADLSVAEFTIRFPRYGRLENIKGCLSFDTIYPEFDALLAEVTAIQLDDEGALSYHRGVHICVDNCANNGISDENEVRRLFYPPQPEKGGPAFASAFIVIGGGTLSRGLTIENLVSTFFLRDSAQADSLMQMGRWFGYRKNYELLPRIWMPNETLEKFEFMAQVEEDLRDELERCERLGTKPSEFGPRVRVSPRISWLRPTAKNRMQCAKESMYDFSGVNRQTTLFHDGTGSAKIHCDNLELTRDFLRARGDGDSGRFGSQVWKGVKVSDVSEFLRGFIFHPASQFFSDISPFLKWLEEHAKTAGFDTWNVVVAGTEDKAEGGWGVSGINVGRVTRTRLNQERSDGAVSIGALRDPRDLLADLGPEVLGIPSGKPFTNTFIEDMRKKHGVGHAPQLLLYLVDKDSKPKLWPVKDVGNDDVLLRHPLAAQSDIVGISIWLPGASSGKQKSFVTHVTVKIPSTSTNDADWTWTSSEGTE
ncbi:Z1 domain-containing protein [Pseudomonas chlororaphis]|uniref:Z1 domain-containing protein n=1 Tax=Pseudomonas chlororaphis TaxID=587753 RepID=UPI000D100F2A|nr:Z1 domain-containing protein [Pseudomonas chlororaphis]AVO58606.1 endonuclease [Pseudomonas chlororaphis subsp. piscium]